MIDFLSYLIFKFFKILVYILPDKLCYYLGIAIGKFAYILTPDKRKRAYKNLKKAFDGEYSEKELEDINKKVYHNIGLIFVEFLLLERLNKDNLNKYLEIENEEYLKKAYEDEKGVVIFGAHFSNWELMAAAISLLGYSLNAIAEKQSYLNSKVNKIREANNINIIPRGMSVRNVYKHLRNGELIYILGDQNARNRGWEMDFFQKPSSTFPGAVQFSSRTGAKIVPTFLVRKKWGKYKLKFYEAVEVAPNASREKQKEILQDLVDLTEEVIRKNPSQWLWIYNKWRN